MIVVFSTTTLTFEVRCSFKTETDWLAVNNVYYCDLDLPIESEKLKNDMVTSVTGCHLHSHYNRDVVGFRARNTSLQYFPKGLDQYFNAEKIEFIAIWASGLKEIHENDLSPFINVKAISFWNNELEVIERDLFKFNRQVEQIFLGRNKIRTVDGNVFDSLIKLRTLFMDLNVCIARQTRNDRRAVLKIIEEVKEKCKG